MLNEDPTKHLKQWHETSKVEENGVLFFLKKYEPESYEIKNEISWLTSTMIRSCSSFKVPDVKESSVEQGYVKMEHIDVNIFPTNGEIVDFLTASAVELHSLISTNEPRLRTKISQGEYTSYLHNFTKERIERIDQEFKIQPEVSYWIHNQIEALKFKYFSIVHRDLRLRHMLFTEGEKPTLVDWEFSNISDPAQDLAKLIYDGVVNHRMDREKLTKKVVDNYTSEIKISSEELEKKILAFLPIIPLEHGMSFVKRRPSGYEVEVMKDLAFITTLYEEKK
jgi:hypothetical protein